MIINWLTGYPEQLREDVMRIRESGMRIVGRKQVPIVETATGKLVVMCEKIVFRGNWFQGQKAKKIIRQLHEERTDDED